MWNLSRSTCSCLSDDYLVFDRYIEFSTKCSARKARGTGGCRVNRIMQIVCGGKLLWFLRISLQSQKFSSKLILFIIRCFLDRPHNCKTFLRITRSACNYKNFPSLTICIMPIPLFLLRNKFLLLLKTRNN